MQLLVKTLKGGKFPVEAEPTNTVAEVKVIIENANAEMPAANIKLIHSGKVLKDEVTLDSAGVKPNDFLVVMVTKPKKAVTPAAAAVEAPSTPAPAAPAAAGMETEAVVAETPAPTDAATEAPLAPARAPADEFPPEMVANLIGMGFPEPEVRHCLRAANGNPDVAVEFLTNGIPEQVEQVAVQPSAGGAPLQNLRNHPQFDDLRRLVQSNPQMLQQVLTQIGQQQPELLQEINANQAVFLQMMNEPISESASAPGPRAISSPASSAGAGGLSPEMMAGMADPTQMAQMMQNMNPQQLQMMANMMGLSPDQLQAVGRMIGQMPPEQLQEYMQQAMQQGGGDGDGGVDDMPSGAHVLRLSEEEMAAVDRLTEMGFDRAEAAQAFLACDKNEALAANLLMDGGFGFGNDDLGGGGGNGDDMDDMYD